MIGLLQRGGKVFTEIVENCSKAALMPIIKGQVLSEATVGIAHQVLITT